MLLKSKLSNVLSRLQKVYFNHICNRFGYCDILIHIQKEAGRQYEILQKVCNA